MATQERLVNELEHPSRYLVGIDLGDDELGRELRRHQRGGLAGADVRRAAVGGRGSGRGPGNAASCHYQPAAGELAAGALRLPWSREEPASAVGFFARDYGVRRPGRLIVSAKSWLCHSGVDRTAELLPWHGAADVERLSPVEVSARFLRHVRDAWDHRFPREPLSEQDLVVTLPASFDELARELTVQAAAAAGLPRVVLIEETAGGLLRLDRRARDRLGSNASRPDKRSWSVTSAAGRPTLR